MDSKLVSQRIRADIWPALKKAGFAHFSTRSAWRHRPATIDVLNFQSFNSAVAQRLGCTTYSFAINLGCYFLDVPAQFPPGVIDEQGGKLLPREYHCHVRRALQKGLRQRQLKRDDLWYVEPDGQNLEAVMQDARRAAEAALPWFDRYGSTPAVLHLLLHDKEDLHRAFGFGADPSPMRSFLIGYMALAGGQPELARRHLQAVLDSPAFPGMKESIAATLAQLRGTGDKR